MTAIKIKILLPIIFILLIVVGAVLVLFPGAFAPLWPTHDPYVSPDDPNYYTGDLAGTAFELWGVTTSGDVLITDMESFSVVTGAVYYGNDQLSNVYINILCSYATEGFVYGDIFRPLTLTGVIGVDDWTAYRIVDGGSDYDIYNLPYSLYGFTVDPGTTDDERTYWVSIRSISISPSAPTSDDAITVTAYFEAGYTSNTGEDNLISPEGTFVPSSALGLTATLQYTVAGVVYGQTMSVSGDMGTCVIPPQQSGAVVTLNVKPTGT